MTLVILFILGTVIGSFLNVVALRWDTKDFFISRSKCPKCDKKLRWYELVPLLSFLSQQGKCRECHNKISWQYPSVEILTGLVFVTVPLLMIPIFAIYIVILIYDFRYKIIPDELVYLAIFVGLLFRIHSYFLLHTSNYLDLLAGPIVFIFFAGIWLLSHGKALGFGDAKLGLSIGLLLGASEGFSAIILAFWIGTLVILGYILLGKLNFLKGAKKLTMKSEMPFAPFIITGAWFGLILHLNLLHVILF